MKDDDCQNRKDDSPQDGIEILDHAPDVIRRPLCIVGDHAYAATWIWAKKNDNSTQVLAVIRDDGHLFSDAPLPGGQSFSHLGIKVALPETPSSDRVWSGTSVKRYLEGQRPDPADVYTRAVEIIDHFMDFKRSLAGQRVMAELASCYVFATYFLDAFNVIGYLWPNGERGSGKTHFLHTVTELAYLGQVILAGGSYASLRDLADYGATLAFDDCEDIMNRRRGDPDKRALLLAGNRRGATVTFKEPTGNRGWKTRHVQTYCPRLFSAIRLPDSVLASRAITVPLIRSANREKTNSDPLDNEAWPHKRQPLIDALWAVALANLTRLRRYEKEAIARAKLSGRDLEPWRAIFAVALWLQEEHKMEGLFDRMQTLSLAYQEERSELEAYDQTRLTIQALSEMFPEDKALYEFSTKDLTDKLNELAVEKEIAEDDVKFTNSKRVGRLLERLRFEKAQRSARQKRWKITKDELEALARSYGMGLGLKQNGTHGTNGNTAQEEVPSCQECHDDPEVVPEEVEQNTTDLDNLGRYSSERDAAWTPLMGSLAEACVGLPITPEQLEAEAAPEDHALLIKDPALARAFAVSIADRLEHQYRHYGEDTS